ncbi:hypothetical protein HK096_009383, partial [Nowakowskiella sp. JEL0078]
MVFPGVLGLWHSIPVNLLTNKKQHGFLHALFISKRPHAYQYIWEQSASYRIRTKSCSILASLLYLAVGCGKIVVLFVADDDVVHALMKYSIYVYVFLPLVISVLIGISLRGPIKVIVNDPIKGS